MNCTMCSLNNTVSIVTRLWVGRYGVQILAGARYLCHVQNVHSLTRSHLASYSVGTGSTAARAWEHPLTCR